MKRFRDSTVGRFVTETFARANPGSTQSETVSDCPDQLATCKWRLSGYESVLLQTSGDLRNMVMHHSITPEKLSKIAKHLEDVVHPPTGEPE